MLRHCRSACLQLSEPRCFLLAVQFRPGISLHKCGRFFQSSFCLSRDCNVVRCFILLWDLTGHSSTAARQSPSSQADGCSSKRHARASSGLVLFTNGVPPLLRVMLITLPVLAHATAVVTLRRRQWRRVAARGGASGDFPRSLRMSLEQHKCRSEPRRQQRASRQCQRTQRSDPPMPAATVAFAAGVADGTVVSPI